MDDDKGLFLEIEGREYRFAHGSTVVVGSDPTCDVVSDDPLVAPQHLAFESAADGWMLRDLGSGRLTFSDGFAIGNATVTPIQGAFMLHLGDDDAGVELRVVTAGTHYVRRRSKTPLLFGIAAILLLAIGVIGVIAASVSDGGGGAGSETNTAAQLAAAKESTVLLIALNESGESWHGSGAFVTSDGHILTNRHVADGADIIGVGVNTDEDQPSEVGFLAEVASVHPYLDLALLEVVSDLDGNPVELDVPALPIGDSELLTTGTEVDTLGYSFRLSGELLVDEFGTLVTPSVSVSRGDVANFRIWPGCNNPNREALLPSGEGVGGNCADEGDIPRGVMVSTAVVSEGGSGGPTIANGELVGVVYAVDVDEGNVGYNMPSEQFSAWLESELS